MRASAFIICMVYVLGVSLVEGQPGNCDVDLDCRPHAYCNEYFNCINCINCTIFNRHYLSPENQCPRTVTEGCSICITGHVPWDMDPRKCVIDPKVLVTNSTTVMSTTPNTPTMSTTKTEDKEENWYTVVAIVSSIFSIAAGIAVGIGVWFLFCRRKDPTTKEMEYMGHTIIDRDNVELQPLHNNGNLICTSCNNQDSTAATPYGSCEKFAGHNQPLCNAEKPLPNLYDRQLPYNPDLLPAADKYTKDPGNRQIANAEKQKAIVGAPPNYVNNVPVYNDRVNEAVAPAREPQDNDIIPDHHGGANNVVPDAQAPMIPNGENIRPAGVARFIPAENVPTNGDIMVRIGDDEDEEGERRPEGLLVRSTTRSVSYAEHYVVPFKS